MTNDNDQATPVIERPEQDPFTVMLLSAHVDLAVRLAATLGKGKGSRLLRDHCRALRAMAEPLGYEKAADAITTGIEVFAEARGLDATEDGAPPRR